MSEDIHVFYPVGSGCLGASNGLLNGIGRAGKAPDKSRVRVRLAREDDIEAVKALADANREALGFVQRSALLERIQKKALLVAEIEGNVVGFLSFHHRQDGWTTLRELCVGAKYRALGAGGQLLNALECEVQKVGQTGIRLKCPIDLPANGFYGRIGFQRVGIEPGKRRPLVLWEKRLSSVVSPPSQVLQFYLTLTGKAYEIRQFLRAWGQSGDPRQPFSRLILSPLFAPPSTLKLMQELKENLKSTIIFDSGGYQVQMGKISYEELFAQLLRFYRQNLWADWYVLPDHVPCSTDSEREVEYKVRETIEYARLFVRMMPEDFSKKALGVVHGRTLDQIVRCMDAYAEMGLSYIGFGSFGTSGPKGAINLVSRQSIQLLQRVQVMAWERGLHLHIFGIGNPTHLWRLARAGIFPTSFDSSGWWKAGAFGNVFFPGGRQLHVTALRTPQTTLEGLTHEKQRSAHDCPFCQDLRQLRRERLLRILHNLAATLDTVQQIQDYYLENWQSNYPNLEDFAQKSAL